MADGDDVAAGGCVGRDSFVRGEGDAGGGRDDEDGIRDDAEFVDGGGVDEVEVIALSLIHI